MSVIQKLNHNEKLGPFGTVFERDNTFENLEKSLLKTLEEIIPKEEPKKIDIHQIKEVSFEDILRDLLEAKKSLKG